MRLRKPKRSFMRHNMIAIIGLCLGFYFCYHLVAGERSYIRYHVLEKDLAAETAVYNDLSARRSALETSVAAMRPSSLSRDMLEQRVAAVLGYYVTDHKTIIMDVK